MLMSLLVDSFACRTHSLHVGGFGIDTGLSRPPCGRCSAHFAASDGRSRYLIDTGGQAREVCRNGFRRDVRSRDEG